MEFSLWGRSAVLGHSHWTDSAGWRLVEQTGLYHMNYADLSGQLVFNPSRVLPLRVRIGVFVANGVMVTGDGSESWYELSGMGVLPYASIGLSLGYCHPQRTPVRQLAQRQAPHGAAARSSPVDSAAQVRQHPVGIACAPFPNGPVDDAVKSGILKDVTSKAGLLGLWCSADRGYVRCESIAPGSVLAGLVAPRDRIAGLCGFPVTSVRDLGVIESNIRPGDKVTAITVRGSTWLASDIVVPREPPQRVSPPAVRPAFPPRLEARLAFAEMGKKDSALDASEEAHIVVTVTNKGEGEANDLRVKAEPISSMSGITVGREQTIERLAAGASDSVSIQLRAADDLKDQEVRFRISAIEPTFGADAPPAVIAITTRRLEPPDLFVYDKAITDDPKKSDYTDGNGNGQWETNEQVELTFAIQNKGTGPAEGAEVEVATTSPNVIVMGGRVTFGLGDVAAGDYRMVKCPVYVNPRFQDSGVRLVLNIQDERPRFAWSDTVMIPLNQQVKEASEVVVAPKRTSRPPATVPPPSLTDSLLVGIPRGPQNPDAFAVVIGAANYRDVTKVEYAAKDAEAMRKYLIEALGYLDGNIITLPDPTSGDLNRVFGTASRPDGQLYNLVSAKPGRCDVFVYYAGHGAPSVREKRGYLVPIDASPDYIEQNGYPLDLFYSNLSKVLAKDLIVVLDACFTGEAPDTSGRVRTLVRDASPVPVASVTEDVPANSLVMTAAKSNQLACWYRDKRHSLFTYWLLRGLKGEADLDRDGRIVVGELDEYVRQNVPPLARLLYNRDQTPEIRGAAGKELLRIR